jgi:hypothetical protein
MLVTDGAKELKVQYWMSDDGASWIRTPTDWWRFRQLGHPVT